MPNKKNDTHSKTELAKPAPTSKTSSRIVSQSYPRIEDATSPDYYCLDDSKLAQHTRKIELEEMKKLIVAAINYANRKSSREIISIPFNTTQEQIDKIYEKEGKNLLKYFRDYCGDPASTAHQVLKKHYTQVGKEQFRNKTLQRERMNSGWRYQHLAKDCASHSGRFKNVSDLGGTEEDFNALIDLLGDEQPPISLYISVKNRIDTLGGQDWPKAIEALETVAKNDKNRPGPYCCVFGIAMQRGFRRIIQSKKLKRAYSENTEVWLSDFFWPFFANCSYEEIMTLVLGVLVSKEEPEELSTEVDVPSKVLDYFGKACSEAGLVDESGYFNDPYKLVLYFCNSKPQAKARKK